MNFLPRCRLSYSKIVQTTQERHRHPVTAHLSRRQPLCLLRPLGRQSVAAAAQRPYVLLPLCPSVSRISGYQSTLRRQPLCFLRPPGRQSVAVRRAAALYVSYVNLCSYVPALSGKHKRHIFCPYVLMFLCLPH